MKYIFVIVFALVYLFADNSLGFCTGSALYTHVTFIFQHAGIIHLLINSLSFFLVYTTMRNIMSAYIFVPVALISTFVSSFVSIEIIPTIGASGMIYAMIGIYICATLLNDTIKITDTRRYLLFLFIIALSLIVSIINPTSNFFLHAYSLLFGFSACLIINAIKLIFKTTDEL